MKHVLLLSALALVFPLRAQAPTTSPISPQPIGDPLASIEAPAKLLFQNVKVKLQPPAPPLPPEAKAKGVQGDLVVEVWVDEIGTPLKSKVLAGPKELFNMCESYLMRWRFYPFIQDGAPKAFRTRLFVPVRVNTPNAQPYQSLSKNPSYWAFPESPTP